MPLNAVSRANFAQMSTMIVSLRTASMPADRAKWSSCSSSGNLAGVRGPNMSRFMAVWRMTPGSEITAGDVSCATGYMRASDRSREHVHTVNAILKRHDKGVFSHKRRQQTDRGLGVVEFDGEEDEIDGSDCRRIVSGVDAW